jgi:hypothetical protein
MNISDDIERYEINQIRNRWVHFGTLRQVAELRIFRLVGCHFEKRIIQNNRTNFIPKLESDLKVKARVRAAARTLE